MNRIVEKIRAMLASAPLGAFLVVIVGWILGAVAGWWTAARLAAQAGRRIKHDGPGAVCWGTST